MENEKWKARVIERAMRRDGCIYLYTTLPLKL